MIYEWIQTDDLQFVLQKTKTVFDVIEIEKVNKTTYHATCRNIDITRVEKGDLTSILKSYGYSGEKDVKSQYGDSANQIIAECISESANLDTSTFTLHSIENVNSWLIERDCNLQIK